MDNHIKQFSGDWALILGGSSGFGLAAVEKLAAHGMHIAVLYRETAAVEREAKARFARAVEAAGGEVRVLAYNVNALDKKGREDFVREFAGICGKGSVRLLLHSIARGNLKPLVGEGGEAASDKRQAARGEATLSIEDIQLTSYAMSTSLLDWARALLEAGLFRKDARIIGLTSEGAHKFWEGYAAVSIAKASLESLTMYMAVELGKHGLRTNLIQAGVTETPSLMKIPASRKLVEMSAARSPLGRMTRPEDVAGAIYLLCMDEAAWINGAVIHVDGGEHCV